MPYLIAPVTIYTEDCNYTMATNDNFDKYEAAKAQLGNYFNKIDDRMSHIEQIHLPSFLSRKFIYDVMVEDFTDGK